MGESPIVVIIDFTLVVGMDSSAAHAVAKLKKIIHRLFHVEVSMFVTGSDRGGFPCEYALSEELAPQEAAEYHDDDVDADIDWNDMVKIAAVPTDDVERQSLSSSKVTRGSISVSPGTASMFATRALASAGITKLLKVKKTPPMVALPSAVATMSRSATEFMPHPQALLLADRTHRLETAACPVSFDEASHQPSRDHLPHRQCWMSCCFLRCCSNKKKRQRHRRRYGREPL